MNKIWNYCDGLVDDDDLNMHCGCVTHSVCGS